MSKTQIHSTSEEITEVAILVGINLKSDAKKDDNIDIDDSMEELKDLAEAAGAEVAGILVQNKDSIDKAYFVGKGKIDEIKEYADNLEATLVIFNDELSGSQIRNIEQVLGIRVIDRTTLILDIFAQRALSREGKLQVELAQLRYRLPRLVGMGTQMSRTGAGIGTRGPGEKKLEKDRRHILSRADAIRRELKSIKKNRQTQREKRTKSELPIVALVGYTNAGKSSLLNELIKSHEDYEKDKEVFVKNMLFATLDVTLRRATLPNKKDYLVVDTVGFVSKLPHDLVDAFKSTLEEVNYADLIVHVIDATNESFEIQKDTTESVLKELGAGDKKQIIAYNKIDKLDLDVFPRSSDKEIYISAKKGINLDKLVDVIQHELYSDYKEVRLSLPFDKGGLLSKLKDDFEVGEIEYTENGMEFDAVVDEETYNRLREYEVTLKKEI